MSKKKVLLLLSGGIDSTTLLVKLKNEKKEIVALSFDYGQKHKIELDFAKQNALKYKIKEHYVVPLSDIFFNNSSLINDEIKFEKTNSYVPFRNLVFLSLAMSFAENKNINEVYISINKEDALNYWDCEKDFIVKVNSIANINSDIKIQTPFINLEKREIIDLAKRMDVNLNETISCYQPNGNNECGICLSCKLKNTYLD